MSKVRRCDDNVIPDTREIRLFGKIRNERTRLPFFLSYYRSLGVGRFFIVDNGSADGSAEFLCGEPDCHVFLTEESMAVSRAGMSWLEPLLATYGLGRWCIVVDADELLVHPQAEAVPLPQFCANLERTGANALPCIMLDMYPAGDIDHADYQAGQSFIEASPFLDRTGYRWFANGAEGPTIYGGPRLRMFYPELVDRSLVARLRRRIAYHLGKVFAQLTPRRGPLLNKVPLVRWNAGMSFGSAAHYLHGARLAPGNGALLHFKFIADFRHRVNEEIVRRAYFRGGEEYARYYARFGAGAAIDFSCDDSVRYSGASQLAELGLVRAPQDMTEGMPSLRARPRAAA